MAIVASCKETKSAILTIDCKDQVKDYEAYLTGLDKGYVYSLDSAMIWFRQGFLQCRDMEKQDSMFMPFFALYNEVGDSMVSEKDARIELYGYTIDSTGQTWVGQPSESTFLKDSIIAYLSVPMRSFCIQNLKEYDDELSFQSIMRNTLWWDKFKKDHEGFFLMDMVDYHYEQWHLRHLISGYKSIKVLDEKNVLLESVEKKYREIIKHNSSSSTAKILTDLLSRIEKNGMKYPENIPRFVDEVLK